MSDTEPKPGLPETLAGIRDLYAGSLAAHGVDSKSVGWKDEASQILRFERLSRLVDPGDGPFTVNDWGCGYGAMFSYFDARFVESLAGYTGYDISPEMLEVAQRTVTSPRARFVLGSDAVEADYTFVSGTFNVRLQSSEAEWERYVQERLEALFAVSRRGLAFNLLTSHVDWKEDHLFYADPAAFVDFCVRRLSRFVTLSHETPLYEWTLIVHREPRR